MAHYVDWPVPGSAPPTSTCAGSRRPARATLGLRPAAALDRVTWTDAPSQSETTNMNDAGRRADPAPGLPLGAAQAGRCGSRARRSSHLRAALRPRRPTSGAMLVDYGAGTQVTRNGEGIPNTRRGPAGARRPAQRRLQRVLPRGLQAHDGGHAVARHQGILDSSNRFVADSAVARHPRHADRFHFAAAPPGPRLPGRAPDRRGARRDYSGFSSVRGDADAPSRSTRKASRSRSRSSAARPRRRPPAGSTVAPVLTRAGGPVAAQATAPPAPRRLPAPSVDRRRGPDPGVACAPARAAFPVGDDDRDLHRERRVRERDDRDVHGDGDQAAGHARWRRGRTAAPARPSAARRSRPARPRPPPPRRSRRRRPPGRGDRGRQRPGRADGAQALRPRRPGAARVRLSGTATVKVTVTRHGARRATKTGSARLKAGRRSLAAEGQGAARRALRRHDRRARGERGRQDAAPHADGPSWVAPAYVRRRPQSPTTPTIRASRSRAPAGIPRARPAAPRAAASASARATPTRRSPSTDKEADREQTTGNPNAAG